MRSCIIRGMSVISNLQFLMERGGLNPHSLAKRSGVPQPTIFRILEGESTSPRDKTLRPLAEFFGVSIQDLRYGDLAGQSDSEPSPSQAAIAEDQADYGGEPSEADYALIAQYDARAAAGSGCLNDHVEVKGGLAFKRDWLAKLGLKPENLRVIYADGDSMADTIMDGEVMLVDCSDREPRSGKIYAILRPNNEVSVKRLVQKPISGTWTVTSDNPDKKLYPDEDATAEVLHEIPIIGRVAWRGGGL